MKSLLLLLLGAALGALGHHFYLERNAAPASPARVSSTQPEAVPTPTLGEKVNRAAQGMGEKTRELARETHETVSEKLKEWKLTPADVQEDLRRGGEIVRKKARQTGAGLSDARILAVVKAKYVLDRELSARAIDVDVAAGQVTLRGEVSSAPLVGHAIALALDTDGVATVVSRLSVATH